MGGVEYVCQQMHVHVGRVGAVFMHAEMVAIPSLCSESNAAVARKAWRPMTVAWCKARVQWAV